MKKVTVNHTLLATKHNGVSFFLPPTPPPPPPTIMTIRQASRHSCNNDFTYASNEKEKKRAQFVLGNIQEATCIYFEKQMEA